MHLRRELNAFSNYPGSLEIAMGTSLGTWTGRYAQFVKKFRLEMEALQKRINNGEPIEPSDYFGERFKLTDDYRSLPYLTPDLTEKLLSVNRLRSEGDGLF